MQTTPLADQIRTLTTALPKGGEFQAIPVSTDGAASAGDFAQLFQTETPPVLAGPGTNTASGSPQPAAIVPREGIVFSTEPAQGRPAATTAWTQPAILPPLPDSGRAAATSTRDAPALPDPTAGIPVFDMPAPLPTVIAAPNASTSPGLAQPTPPPPTDAAQLPPGSVVQPTPAVQAAVVPAVAPQTSVAPATLAPPVLSTAAAQGRDAAPALAPLSAQLTSEAATTRPAPAKAGASIVNAPLPAVPPNPRGPDPDAPTREIRVADSPLASNTGSDSPAPNIRAAATLDVAAGAAEIRLPSAIQPGPPTPADPALRPAGIPPGDMQTTREQIARVSVPAAPAQTVPQMPAPQIADIPPAARSGTEADRRPAPGPIRTQPVLPRPDFAAPAPAIPLAPAATQNPGPPPNQAVAPNSQTAPASPSRTAQMPDAPAIPVLTAQTPAISALPAAPTVMETPALSARDLTPETGPRPPLAPNAATTQTASQPAPAVPDRSPLGAPPSIPAAPADPLSFQTPPRPGPDLAQPLAQPLQPAVPWIASAAAAAISAPVQRLNGAPPVRPASAPVPALQPGATTAPTAAPTEMASSPPPGPATPTEQQVVAITREPAAPAQFAVPAAPAGPIFIPDEDLRADRFSDIPLQATGETSRFDSPREIARLLADPAIPRQIATQLADLARQMPDRPVELTLNPEELGRVRMTLNASDNAISVTLAVERPETADLLRRSLDALAEEFRALGYSDVTFSFSGGETQQDSPDSRGETPGTVPPTGDADTDSPEPARATLDLGAGMDLRL